MTAEEAANNLHAASLAFREQGVRNLQAMTGCDRAQAERLHDWISAGGLERMERAGQTLGARLAEVFKGAFAALDRYRT